MGTDTGPPASCTKTALCWAGVPRECFRTPPGSKSHLPDGLHVPKSVKRSAGSCLATGRDLDAHFLPWNPDFDAIPLDAAELVPGARARWARFERLPPSRVLTVTFCCNSRAQTLGSTSALLFKNQYLCEPPCKSTAHT